MSFKVHDGSFGKGGGNFSGGVFYLPKRSGWGFETVRVAQVLSAEIASEQSVKRLGGTIGWGAAGGLVLGPVGLLAGLLLGGKKTEVAFIVSFDDGKAFIATADHKVWIAIKGASLGPASANLAARGRIAARALASTSELPVKRSPPLTGPPEDYVDWAFDEGGWTYQKVTKQGHKDLRYTKERKAFGLFWSL